MEKTQAEMTREKLAARVANMGNEELAAYTSKCMMGAEAAIEEGAKRLCAASTDRLDAPAFTMLVMKRSLHQIKAVHCDLSAANAQMLAAPIPLGGDR